MANNQLNRFVKVAKNHYIVTLDLTSCAVKHFTHSPPGQEGWHE